MFDGRYSPVNICQITAKYLPNILEICQTLSVSTKYPPNVCRMSVEYLTTMSDTFYANSANSISAKYVLQIPD